MSNENNNQMNTNDEGDDFPIRQVPFNQPVSQQPTLGAFGIKPSTVPFFGMGLPQTQSQTQTQTQSTGGFTFGGFHAPPAMPSPAPSQQAMPSPPAMPSPAPSQQATSAPPAMAPPRSMCGGIGGIGGTFVPFGTNSNNDKKKLIDSLYIELGKIRAEIEKLHKSTDVIYEILRNI